MTSKDPLSYNFTIPLNVVELVNIMRYNSYGYITLYGKWDF